MDSRQRVIEGLARASAQGRLGLLVGSGLSIALTANARQPAPNWRGLLERVAEELKLEMPPPEEAYGTSFPRIASQLVEQLVEHEGIDAALDGEDFGHGSALDLERRAIWLFKSTVARLCHFDLDKSDKALWTAALDGVNAAWFVTTNYDLLVEDLVPNSSAILPSEVMTIPRSGPVPVFHLHGHRLDPSSIVVLDQDYTALFRPGDYRQRKLSLLLAESVVLVVGYSLGDVNVLSALDLAGTYGPPSKRGSAVVQALWCDESTNPEPRTGPRGETVLEISDLRELLLQVGTRRAELVARGERDAASVTVLLESAAAREAFGRDENATLEYWEAMRNHADLSGNRDVLEVLSTILDEIWEQARSDGGFPRYRTFLAVVLAGFHAFGDERAHPAILTLLTERLLDVAPYIEPENKRLAGYSWAASTLWAAHRRALSPRLTQELKQRAESRGSPRLADLLPTPGTREMPVYPHCPKCGALPNRLSGGTSVDDERDDTYFDIKCLDCGWSDGGEV